MGEEIDEALRTLIRRGFEDAKKGIYMPLDERTGMAEERLLFSLDELYFMIAHRDFQRSQQDAIASAGRFLNRFEERLPTEEELQAFNEEIIALRRRARTI